jgi:hypothetical protein
MKVRHVYLHLREHGRSLIVLQVHSFDFFRYGLTEVYSTAPSLAQLKGRQYQSLGQAAQDIHVHIHGKDRGYVNYSLEYEAYCMGLSEEACATQLGTATRRVVSHGEQFEVPFSPELLTTFCITEPDSLAPGGRWLACCHLLPMVPLGVDDSVAEARLAQLMSEDRHHVTVGSRQRRLLMASGGGGSSTSTSTRTHAAASSSSTHAAASSSTRTSASSSGNSRTHAEASGMRRDDHRDWRAGRAQTSDAPGGERSSIERAPKRARFSTKEGLCVYRLADDMNTPHEIISHWLVEQAVPGRQSMKMLKLRPLFPPTANTLDVPAVETVSLNERFKSVWEAHSFDPVSDELESTSRTASNGGLYDAHIRAVVLQARRVQMSEWLMFHQLRWGEGNLAYAPTPPELRVGVPLHR